MIINIDFDENESMSYSESEMAELRDGITTLLQSISGKSVFVPEPVRVAFHRLSQVNFSFFRSPVEVEVIEYDNADKVD